MFMIDTDRGEGKLVTAIADSKIATSAPSEPARGLGDTIARLTHATGLDKLAHLYTRVTGKDCGCQGRQAALNKFFPYEKPK